MAFGLCKYKDIIGKPNTGIHSYKLYGISVLDVLVVVGAAYVIDAVFLPSRFRGFWRVLFILFITGIIVHRLFCVRTTIDKLLFP
jgi:hypothetical protein